MHCNKSNIYFPQYFEHIEEMEWAIQVCKEAKVPVAATMCIGPEGDLHGVTTGECGVRMAKAGTIYVYDSHCSLETPWRWLGARLQ